MRRAALGALVALSLLAPLPTARAIGNEHNNGSVYVSVTPTSVTLGNALVERTWDKAAFRTAKMSDKRAGSVNTTFAAPDFALTLANQTVESTVFSVAGVTTTDIPGGVRVVMSLTTPGGALTAQRIAEAYDGIAGIRTQTIVTSAAPLTLTGARLETVAAGTDKHATLHAFRAGADWREPGWTGPDATVGDPHAGTWRHTTKGGPAASVAAAAQYVTMANNAGRSVFIELERNDFPSSRAAFDGRVGSVSVDYTRDVISLGPLEESGHAENPTDAPAGRVRTIKPLTPFAFEPTFTGFGRTGDDEAWQFHKYLVKRMGDYEKGATFNSNGTDSNQISTGAKDDLDFATIQQVAPLAKRLGVSTFILDDGWQAISGDWHPDSPGYPEPRGGYAPRFPDATFAAVRAEIAPMKLGLWMSPTFFNPASETFKAHPEWVCQPIGSALVPYNIVEPNSSSNEAGLGPWGPDALPYVKSRIDTAIREWGVSYFKFDFLAWFDCAGQGDLYDFHDRFVGMLDALRAEHPGVTFEIDETNDYRLFPFESVSRGPSWFQNGSPTPSHLLHNIWNLSPWIPAFSLGQHFLGDYRGTDPAAIDLRMAVAMLSHPTFFADLRKYDGAALDRASTWLRFRGEHLDAFTGVVYPLLSDPIEGGWTALQSWDAEAGSGALLAFRQGSAESSRVVALRNVPAGRTFNVIAAPTGEVVGTVTSAQLASGINVEIPEQNGQRVLLVVPASS